MLREKLAVEPESVYDYLTKTLIDSIQYSETSKSVSVLHRQTINERTPRDHLERESSVITMYAIAQTVASNQFVSVLVLASDIITARTRQREPVTYLPGDLAIETKS